MKLVVFFTRGMSLSLWDSEGLLNRELALYHALARLGVSTTFVTYGGPEDLALAERPNSPLRGMGICCNAGGLPPAQYALAVPELHAGALAACDLIMTNQTNGAEVALAAARRWGKPLVARCGYMWSEFCARRLGPQDPETARAFAVEAEVFPAAAGIVLTTPMMRDDLLGRHPQLAERVQVIPNYVPPALYEVEPRDDDGVADFIFVGRLAAQKNLPALLQAVRQVGCTLLCVGKGELEAPLRRDFADLEGRVRWRGVVPHDELAGIFAGARASVLPSLYEGHPKALIEAMAAGLAVIGADSPGIREVLRHEDTGLVCPTDAAGIADALARLMGDGALRARLAQNGRAFARAHYHLDAVSPAFHALFSSLAMRSAG